MPSTRPPLSAPAAAAAPRSTRARLRLPMLRRKACMAYAWAIFALSITPAVITLLQQQPTLQASSAPLLAEAAATLRALPQLGEPFGVAQDWYVREVVPVQEMRQPAALPSTWQGEWYAVDKNYASFEKWLGDHIGLRDLMIRSKNEVDYRLFRSSSRVYFGHGNELYGRNLTDRELPQTESVLDTPAKADAVYQGVLRYAERLRQQGVTMLLIAPLSKQYYTAERLPFFAPRVTAQSNFMGLYQRLRQTPQLNLIDTHALTLANQPRFPIYFRQDFHWTDLNAMTVAADTVRRIAELEGSPLRWRHAMEADYLPLIGSETRFAGRLNAADSLLEPQLKKTWSERHITSQRDVNATGLEFETDTLDDASLLPPVCMFGNSFSDGMLRAGLPEHFQKFTKFGRGLPLPQVPALIQGRCKYLIVQVLDIQAGHWLSMGN